MEYYVWLKSVMYRIEKELTSYYSYKGLTVKQNSRYDHGDIHIIVVLGALKSMACYASNIVFFLSVSFESIKQF